jgi:TRAP-type C4-dicarboxylate transport system substrate-binding protein
MRALTGWASTLAVAGIVGFAGQAMAQTKLIFSTYVPETFSVTACDAFFMDEITKRTGGKITFERYYGGAVSNLKRNTVR